MRPTPVSTRGLEQAVLKTPSVSNAWQLGTILKAMALSDSADGAVRLQIGARVVTAQTSLPLLSGQTMRLQVAETGRTVILRSVGEPVHNDPIRTGIRQNLPRQMPQAPLMAATLGLSKTSTLLPAELTVAVGRLVNAMRDPGTLTQSQGLRLAVRDSGVFLEQRLAEATNRPPEALSRDWKAALLRFRNQLTHLQVRLSGDSGAKQPASLVTNAPPIRAGVSSNASPAVSAGVSTTVGQSGAAQSSIPTAAAAIQAVGAGVQALSSANVSPTTIVPNSVTPAGLPSASPQTADGVMPAAAANAQSTVAKNDIPPPMRHALPHPQPVTQSGTLPTDALSLVGELISNSEGALARVRLNQLGSIAPDHGSRMVWLLELPVRHPDNRAEVVTMRIEKDDDGNDTQAQAAWTADLAFDLGAKGELRARVALRAGRVSVLFWADADQTRTEVRDKLPQLKNAMEQKQLDVATLSAGTVQPVAQPVPSATLLETQA